MPNGNYTPSVLADTSNLTRDEWLDWRRKGIGGSDAAAVIGVSPYSTARDLYYEKLNIVTAGDNEDNWVQKRIGHLLEDLVAEIFSKKTGFPVYQVKKMFYHPNHPYMLVKCSQFPSCVDFTGFNGIQNCVYCYYLSFFSKIALKHRPHYFHI